MSFRTNPLPELLSLKMYRTVKVAPDRSGSFAQTSCVIAPSHLALEKRQTGMAVGALDISVSVNWRESWLVTGRGSRDLLEHERVHFFIAICVGRKLYDEILATVKPSAEELQRALDQLHAAAAQLVDTISDAYDAKTDHGAKRAEQQGWAMRVRGWYVSKTLNW